MGVGGLMEGPEVVTSTLGVNQYHRSLPSGVFSCRPIQDPLFVVWVEYANLVVSVCDAVLPAGFLTEVVILGIEDAQFLITLNPSAHRVTTQASCLSKPPVTHELFENPLTGLPVEELAEVTRVDGHRPNFVRCDTPR